VQFEMTSNIENWFGYSLEMSAKVVRDDEGILLVFSNELAKALQIKEGDDLVPIDVESGKLSLELVRTTE
jgi:hypothetical protein